MEAFSLLQESKNADSKFEAKLRSLEASVAKDAKDVVSPLSLSELSYTMSKQKSQNNSFRKKLEAVEHRVGVLTSADSSGQADVFLQEASGPDLEDQLASAKRLRLSQQSEWRKAAQAQARAKATTALARENIDHTEAQIAKIEEDIQLRDATREQSGDLGEALSYRGRRLSRPEIAGMYALFGKKPPVLHKIKKKKLRHQHEVSKFDHLLKNEEGVEKKDPREKLVMRREEDEDVKTDNSMDGLQHPRQHRWKPKWNPRPTGIWG
jgi:uncharacterized protein with PIN domain